MMSPSALFCKVVSSLYSCDALVVCQVQFSYKRKACRVIVSGLLDMVEKITFRRQIFYLEQTIWYCPVKPNRGYEVSYSMAKSWWMDVATQPEYSHILLARATTPHSKRAGVWCICSVRRPRHENVSRDIPLSGGLHA